MDLPDPASLSRNRVPAIDRSALGYRSHRISRTSDWTNAGARTLAVLAAAGPAVRRDPEWGYDAVCNLSLYAEVVLIERGLTVTEKGLFHRLRPYAYNPDVPAEVRNGRNAALSFWSDHTSSAFAAAVFGGRRSGRDTRIRDSWYRSGRAGSPL